MPDTGSDLENGTNESSATKTVYLNSLETARTFARNIQGKTTFTADERKEGRKAFTILCVDGAAHAIAIATAKGDIWTIHNTDDESNAILKVSSQSQAAASAFGRGTLPDLAFLLENEPQAAQASDASSGDTAAGNGAGGDSA
jgi:hypothetical protein